MGDGHCHLRRLDDPTNASGTTLLTLPLSDFPIVGSSAARGGAVVSPAGHNSSIDDEDDISNDDEGGLILMSLPPGILSIDDLVTSNVYIMGPNDDSDNRGEGGTNYANANDGGNSIEPVSARLIIEDKMGKTLILTRVETSNTYIVVPPMKVDAMTTTTTTTNNDEGITTEGGNNKKRKLLSSSPGDEIDDVTGSTPSNQILVTMSARSVGQIPGESSPATFFLEPTLLPPRHFANVLREILYRATYDPFDPPPTTTTTTTKLGYTIHELARLCRTSLAEVSNAIHGRYFGAEDALVLPSGSSVSLRYGTLSEEGRRTVLSAIVSTLVESDTELQWLSSTGGMEGDGMLLSSFIDEIRERWARSEGGTSSSEQYHLPDEVIWSCLRPIFFSVNNKADNKITPGDNDFGILSSMPQLGWLDPDGVAKLVAHEVFLRGGVRGGNMTWWKEGELIDAWSMRLPTIPGGYVPNVGLLRGIAICEMMASSSTMPWHKDDTEEGDLVNKIYNNRRWRYFPESFGLHPSDPVMRIRSLFTMRDAWTIKEAMPYLEKLLLEYDGIGVGGKELSTAMVDLLGRHARATMTNIETKGEVETSVTRYIAKL